MRRKVCFICLLLFIFLLCACNLKSPADTNSSETNGYEYISEYEKKNGLVSMPSGYYTIGPATSESKYVEQGIFKKTDNGYELIINLGVLSGLSFWENDSFFLVSGNILTEYPLSAENPYNSSKSTVLLPKMAEIKKIYYYDIENLYVSATLWDEKNGRSFDEKYYMISRDGTSYKEIEYSEIP
ncbi:MAG: hypothetical protein ACI4JG_02220 [Acutalibacteraceae bacterium]